MLRSCYVVDRFSPDGFLSQMPRKEVYSRVGREIYSDVMLQEVRSGQGEREQTYLLRAEVIEGGLQLVGLHPDGQLVVLGPAKPHLENGRTQRLTWKHTCIKQSKSPLGKRSRFMAASSRNPSFTDKWFPLHIPQRTNERSDGQHQR